ncbi:hypothetical protein HZB01_04225 [Candidatus Woesearchaeota archaeon]|nr:hypothetical protein [Candidatus Woesearchaeota archaeon]
MKCNGIHCFGKCILSLLFLVMFSSQGLGEMLHSPKNITVAVTGFSYFDKAECESKMVAVYGNGSLQGLDAYINDQILTGTPGFYLKTVDFKEYVKDVLPNEWTGPTFWMTESLRSGAVAAKLAPWYTIRFYTDQKWPETGADVVDFTCDQMYFENSNNSRGDKAVDTTWDFYALKNNDLLEARYFDGQAGNSSKVDGLQMTQWGSQEWAKAGTVWEWIFNYYYDNITLAA